MSYTTQWIAEEERNQKKEKATVTKAQKMEKERLLNGWRYINFHPNMSILVPCNRYGNPTKEGLKRIENRKKILSIL